MNDGTFGVTGDVEPFSAELVNRLEAHEFETVKILQWRNNALDFSSLDRLKESLRQAPPSSRLTRARAADDVLALDYLSEDTAIRDIARAPAALRLLWDACQIPDYRKISANNHAELVATLYKYLLGDAGVIPEDWFAAQVDLANRTDGDIDTLSNRISHIRTWTFVSNRQNWLADPEHWRQRTREIEDTLSDALHELLTQRFVDRRTSVLMKSMRDKDTLYADIENGGQIFVEKHYVGKLAGFHFTPDTAASGIHGKAARHAAAKVLASELAMRAERLNEAKDDAFQLSRGGKVLWEKQEIGQLDAGDDPLRPIFALTADEHLSQPDRERIVRRVQSWLSALIETRLKPLIDLSRSQEVTGLARGIAFRLVENLGMLPRDTIATELRALDQQARAELRKFGVRFGAYNIYFPMLLKPAAADLLLLLWALKQGGSAGLDTLNLPEPPRQGLTSVPVDPGAPAAFYRAAGFQICGPRAVRIDMLERLADLIRPLTSWKPTEAQSEPPAGAVGRGGFRVQPEMMSIMGCSSDELGHVLFSLGFRKERRPIAAKPAAPAAEPAQIDADLAQSAGTDGPAVAGEPSIGGDTHASLAAGQRLAVDTEVAIQEIAAGSGEPAPESVAADIAAQAEAHPAIPAEPAPDAMPVEAAAEVVEIASAEPPIEPAMEAVETASADASAAVPAATPIADAAATAEEPQFEEIWRPRRRQEEQRRPAQRRQDRSERQGQPGQHRQRGPRQGDADRPAAAAPGTSPTSRSSSATSTVTTGHARIAAATTSARAATGIGRSAKAAARMRAVERVIAAAMIAARVAARSIRGSLVCNRRARVPPRALPPMPTRRSPLSCSSRSSSSGALRIKPEGHGRGRGDRPGTAHRQMVVAWPLREDAQPRQPARRQWQDPRQSREGGQAEPHRAGRRRYNGGACRARACGARAASRRAPGTACRGAPAL